MNFFSVLGDVVNLLNSYTVIGNLTFWHIVLTGVVILIIGKFVKGSKRDED